MNWPRPLTRDVETVRQAAIDVSRASLDLQLQHLSLAEVDLARLALSADQIQLDSEADDAGAVAGDVVVVESIWSRVVHTVDQSMAEQVNAQLGALRAAADVGDLAAAAIAAAQLRDSLVATP